MANKNIEELRGFINNLKNRILGNINLAKDYLMELIQYSIKIGNEDLSQQLDFVRKRILKLTDKIKVYRIPPLLQKVSRKKTIIGNQIKIIVLYFELLYVETDKIKKYLQGAVSLKEDSEVIITNLKELNRSYDNIFSLYSQLDNYDQIWQIKNLFEIIESKIGKIYPDSDKIKELMNLCEKLNIVELEKQLLPLFLDEIQVFPDKGSDKLQNLIKKQQESIANTLLRDVSLKIDNKNRIIDFISSLGESEDIKNLGGVISVLKLYTLIRKEDKDIELPIDELNDILKDLKKKGYIYDIEHIDNLKLVKFVPLELSNNPKILLESIGFDGRETKESLMSKLNWSEPRLDETLQFLINKKICVSQYDSLNGMVYYFPGLTQKIG